MMDKICCAKLPKPLMLLGAILTIGIAFTGCSPTPQDVNTSDNESVQTQPPAVTVTPVKIPETTAEKAVEAPPAASQVPATATPAPVQVPEPATPAVGQTPVSAAPVPAEAPAAQAPEADTIAAVQAAKDSFELYALQQDTAQLAEKSRTVQEAIDKKWQEFETASAPQNLVEGLDCAAFKMEPADENKAKFSILFKVSAPVSDYHPVLIAEVEAAHKKELTKKEQKRGYAVWEYLTGEPMSKWEAGKRYLVTFEQEVKPLPYRLRLALEVRDAKGQWVKNEGEMAKLGWHAALVK